jgi:hypothetical protein
MRHLDLGLNRIDRILVQIRYTFFSGSSSTFKLSMFNNLRMSDQPGSPSKDSRVRTKYA